MKRFLVAISLLSAVAANAQPLQTPAVSTTQTIKQQFGLGTIELSYSRPNVKGRKIFGELVPFGKVWRTGANNPTTLTFSDTVTIGNTRVAPGKYGLLTIPNADNWTIIITRLLNVTNAGAYKEDADVVRVSARPQTMPSAMESFTMQFGDIKPNSISLYMAWANTMVEVPISTNIDARVMKQINDVVNGDNRPYFDAALYYLENGKDLNKALEWFNKADTQTPDAYWIKYQKARCLAKLNKKDEAKASATQSIALAKKAGNDDYVTLNENLIASLK